MPDEALVEISEPLVIASLSGDPDWRALGNNWHLRTVAECPIGKEDGHGGHLRDNIVVLFEEGAEPSIMVGSELVRDGGVSALDTIYSGADAHEITPKNGKALRFRGAGSEEAGTESGEFVFAKRVHHPGNKPDKFVDRALQQAIVMSGGSAFTA